MKLNALNKFYQSTIGKSARHIIALCVHQMINPRYDSAILGVGYANPYLRRFFPKADVVVTITPPNIGEVRWPRLEDNRCIYADEDHFPLQNNSFDIVVLIHALEFAENPWAMLAEINRVLPVGGRVVVVVPNSGGLWARNGSMPFGHGRPFTKGQLKKLMQSTGFTAISHKYKLFFPPFSIFAHAKVSVSFERWAGWFMRENSGVIIAEYEKKSLEPITTKCRQSFEIKKRFTAGVVSPHNEL